MTEQDAAKEAIERKPGGDNGVFGASGALAHASFQIPSSMGTQELVTEKTSRDDEKSSKIVHYSRTSGNLDADACGRSPGRRSNN